MNVLLFLIAAAHAAKLTQTLDNTQAAFEHQIADLLVGLNYDSKRQTKRSNQITRPSNRRFGMRKLSSQRGAHPNRSKHALTQRRSAIDSLVTNNRRALKRNQAEKNRIFSSMFLV